MKQSHDSELFSVITQLKLFNIHLFVISQNTEDTHEDVCLYSMCLYTLMNTYVKTHSRGCIFPYISAGDYMNMDIYMYA